MIDGLLSRAGQAGIRLWVEGGELHYRVPRRSADPRLLAELRASKPLLVSHLQNLSRDISQRCNVTLRLMPLEQSCTLLPMRIEGLWRAEQFARTVPFHLSFPIVLGSDVDLSVLRDALTVIVSRHEALRSTFAFDAGRPVMVVHDIASPCLDTAEICRDVISRHREGVMSPIDDFIQAPIDLLNEAGFRCRAYRDDMGQVTLFVVVHHYFAEAWSAQILRREILASYARLKTGQLPELPEVTTQFGGYALAQRRFLAANLEDHLGFWRDRLECVAASQLPYDFTRSTNKMGRLFFALDEALMDGINALARDCRVTPAVMLLSAFQILLGAWSKQEQVVTAVNMADRSSEEFRNTVGYLITSVPIASTVGRSLQLRDFFAEAASNFYGAYLYRTLSYDLYDQVVEPPRPFCTTLFNFVPLQVMPSQASDRVPMQYSAKIVPGPDMQRVKVHRELYLNLNELPRGAAGKIYYNLDYFSAETIISLIENFRSVLREVVADAKRTIGEIQDRALR